MSKKKIIEDMKYYKKRLEKHDKFNPKDFSHVEPLCTLLNEIIKSMKKNLSFFIEDMENLK